MSQNVQLSDLPMTQLDLFAACLPGLEFLLEEELRDLARSSQQGLEVRERHPGGVSLTGTREALYLLNLRSGIASHVLLRLGTFPLRHLTELPRRARNLPWREFLRPDIPHLLSASCTRSRIYHSGALERELAKFLSSRNLIVTSKQGAAEPRREPSEAPPLPVIKARLEGDVATLSLDTSGTPLHRRGWRVEGGKAPLREDLAHALLRATGFADHPGPLVDPFLGSGTLVIEAATLARGLPPGRLRSFAFEHFKGFDPEHWSAFRNSILDTAHSISERPVLQGSDRDAGAVKRALANAERAGVQDSVQFEARALRDSALARPLAPRPHTYVVTNPPYGRRIGSSSSLLPLFQSLGTLLRDLPPECRCALYAHDRRLVYATGLRWRSLFHTNAGGLSVHAFEHVLSP